MGHPPESSHENSGDEAESRQAMSTKTRTLTKGGRSVAVTVHRNDGLRKRCECPRRSWATCPHSWYFAFKWRETHHRFPLDKYAAHHIASREDAKHERDRLRREIREGRFPPVPTPATPATPGDLSFEQFASKWRERARADQRPALIANDAAICRRLCALTIDSAVLGARPLSSITEDDLEVVFGQLSALAGSTSNKYRDVLRLLQAWGVRKGYLAKPWFTDDSTIITRKKTARRQRRLVADIVDDKGITQPGEEKRLLQHATPWLYRLIVAALESACRAGELLSLTWADVSLARRVLTVRGENAKSGESRLIPISDRLLGHLQMIRNDPADNAHPPSAFVFGDAIGRQKTFPKKAWETLKLRAHDYTPTWNGGKLSAGSRAHLHAIDLKFHDLRHEAGSRWTDAGWPLSHVQRMLGHADLRMTSVYTNADLRHLQDSMRRYGTIPGQSLHSVAQTPDIEPPLVGNDRTPEASKPVVN